MALVCCVTEMGMGVDVHGLDDTLAAATRAVFDALDHSSLGFAQLVGATADEMIVHVLIGVPRPDNVQVDEVAAALPHGRTTGRWWWVAWNCSTRTAATVRSSPTPSSPLAWTTVYKDERHAPPSSD